MDSAKATRVVSSCSPAPSEPVARRSWKAAQRLRPHRRLANRAPARHRQAISSGRDWLKEWWHAWYFACGVAAILPPFRG